MPRRSSKRFEYGEGIYYFEIKKGFNNNICIKRTTLRKALEAYNMYLRTQRDNCKWLGKWDGKKFIEDDVAALFEQESIVAYSA